MARTKAADYDQKRASILRTSARLFARDGYDRASMSMIAAECGVSKALLYHYHAGKEHLLFDILREHLDFLMAAIRSAEPEGASAQERLRALVGALLEAYEDADAEHKILINDIGLLPARRQEELRASERRIVSVFSEAISGLDWADQKSAAFMKPVTMSLFGMLNWLYHWYRPNGPMSRSDYADIVTALLVDGTRNLPRTVAGLRAGGTGELGS